MIRKRKIFMGNKWNIFIKANGNAGAGFPISYILNILITFPLVIWLHEVGVDWFTGALILGIPFYWASVWRMYGFDYVYEKYNVHIDPKNLFLMLTKKIKSINVDNCFNKWCPCLTHKQTRKNLGTQWW